MPYQRASWFEPQTQAIEHGTLPVNWITTLYGMEFVRWPSQRNVEVMNPMPLGKFLYSLTESTHPVSRISICVLLLETLLF